MPQPKLSEADIYEHLTHLPGWSLIDNAITKLYKFSSFIGSIQFVNQVAQAAEAVNHHPDIYIRYDKVTLTLSTHDSGGVTVYDTQLAAACDDLADQIK